MKKPILSTSLAFAIAAALAAPAVYASGYYDYNYGASYQTHARVLGAAPIVETAYEQREVCRYEYVSKRSNSSSQSSTGSKVVGGVIGGAAGSAVGKGSGRDAAAAVGAVLGSEVAAQDGRLSEGELIGGIAGALIGNQVGNGSGKTAATAAGALIGAIVGDNIQNGDSNSSTSHSGTHAREKVRVCEMKEYPKRVITGYDVTFEHDGQRFSQVMGRDPGEYVQINVHIEALEDTTSLR